MCLLIIQYRTIEDSPVLVVSLREEFYDRPTSPPAIQSGRPRVLCGIDQRAGGTWLGVNQRGVFVAATNRPKANIPPAPRSRGILCREMLDCPTATEAAELAVSQLQTGHYDGVNFVCADAQNGILVYGAGSVETVEITPGLHLITHSNLDDRNDERQQLARRLLTLQQLDSSVAFLAVASNLCGRMPSPPGRPSIVLRGKEQGTVSATLIALGPKPRDAVYQYTPGPPNEHSFEDYSPLLRDILSRGLREEGITPP